MASLSHEAPNVCGMNADRIAADVARHHHGLLTRRDLIEREVTEREIDHRLAIGRWERVYPGVYRIAGVPRSWEQRLLAACLAAAPGWASHRSAARLWGLWTPDRDVVEVVVNKTRGPRLGDTTVHRASDLDAEHHVTVRHGIPVTKPARTLVDLGMSCSQGVVDKAVTDAVASKLVTLDGLRVALKEVGRRGRTGAGYLRRSLETLYGVPDSHLEGLALRVLQRYGVPPPVLQWELVVNGRRYLVDQAWPSARLVVELDGSAVHATPQALVDDNRRQNDLVEAGLTVLRFTHADVAGSPELYAARILRVLGTRAAA